MRCIPIEYYFFNMLKNRGEGKEQTVYNNKPSWATIARLLKR